MKEWFTPVEIADLALPGLPTTRRGVNMVASREGWRDRRSSLGAALTKQRDREPGTPIEYHYSIFPTLAQAKLVSNDLQAMKTASKKPEASASAGQSSSGCPRRRNKPLGIVWR